jgi:transcriptional regulator with XRE-family HTH domain
MRTIPSNVGVLDVFDWIESGRARQLREENGLSLAVVGAELEVTPGAVSLWETRKRRPRGRNLTAYRRLLGELDARARRRPRTH